MIGQPPSRDLDGPWKWVASTYPKEFLKLYYPSIFERINWLEGINQVSSELFIPWGNNQQKKVIADLIWEARLISDDSFNNMFTDTVINPEFYSSPIAKVPEKTFQYAIGAVIKFQKLPLSLTFAADSDPNWRPQIIFPPLGGLPTLTLYSELCKLLDFAPKMDSLIEDNNPAGWIGWATLRSNDRLENKQTDLWPTDLETISERILRSNQPEDKIIGLLTSVENLFPLYIEKDIINYRRWLNDKLRIKNMRLLFSFEKEALKKGRDEGRNEGKLESLIRVLRRKFGESASKSIEIVSRLPYSETLDELLDLILDTNDIHAIETVLSQLQISAAVPETNQGDAVNGNGHI